MLFYVVDPLIPQWPSAPVETDQFTGASQIQSAMWVPFPRSIDPNQIDTFIADACPPFVLRSDIVIIGLHPSSANAVLRTSHILDDVMHRVEYAPVYLVYHYEGRPVIRHARGPRVPSIESGLTLDKIRDRDLAAVVRRPGTELPKHPKIHYQGPNGDHYRAFLRPGLGLRSIEELDRISFWLGPLLSGRSNILVDHWSMIAIAYHVGQYAAREGWTSEPVSVQSLRSYNESIDALSRRIGGTFDRIEPNNGAILISVNSSGKLANNLLTPAMLRAGFRDPTTVAIANTIQSPESHLEALTVLDEDFERHDPASCTVCEASDSVLIPIPYDTYLLSLSAHIHRTAISKKHTDRAKGMISRYRDIDAFKTHVTHSDGRHHAYFVDLLPMLKQDIFQRRATKLLQSWRKRNIGLIIHPSHEAAKSLAAIVAHELRIVKVIECDEKLQDITREDRRTILEENCICIVDDVIISGSRLRGYRNSINRCRRACGHQDSELYCFVGVSRTPSKKVLTSISDMFRYAHGDRCFLCVENLFLPNWGVHDCRWCFELRILNNIPNAMQGLEFVKDRLITLSHGAGLVRGLFPVWPNHIDMSEDYWKLGPDSIFGDVQGADLVISVAAAVQSMRGKDREADGAWLGSELDEVFQSPVAKILAPEFWATNRFYEPVLKASILRCTKAHDIVAPGSEKELLDELQVLVNDESFRGLGWELVLAMAMHQLPRTLYDMMPQLPSELTALVASVLGSK